MGTRKGAGGGRREVAIVTGGEGGRRSHWKLHNDGSKARQQTAGDVTATAWTDRECAAQ